MRETDRKKELMEKNGQIIGERHVDSEGHGERDRIEGEKTEWYLPTILHSFKGVAFISRQLICGGQIDFVHSAVHHTEQEVNTDLE